MTIDGPAGSGKSTIAGALATALGVPHVDTGAYYRAATLAVLRAGVSPGDPAACERVVTRADIRRVGVRTFLDGEDVEEEIRGPAVTAAVSSVSRHRDVRRALLTRQREQISSVGAVVEGRDAGTVVAPEAPLKIWLTATPQERAARRAAQLGEGDREAVERHAADIARRDAADASQMAQSPDAVKLDTTGRSVPDLVAEIASLVDDRMGGSSAQQRGTRGGE